MAYLIDHPPVRDQFYETRNRPLTGCTVLHTAESVMDTVGPDTGAEAVAEFIRTRTTAGSYHDIADSDSYVALVPYESGAYHDGTGSNNWALSISFACGTHHWRQMSPERRRAFLRNGARAFAAQQAWRKAHGYPLTELRYITKAQSDRGESGLTCHGWRDPSRRTDPGINEPDLFPFDEFLAECAIALGLIEATPEPLHLGEDMTVIRAAERDVYVTGPTIGAQLIGDPNVARALARAHNPGGEYIEVDGATARVVLEFNEAERARLLLDVAKAAGGDVDEAAIIAGLRSELTELMTSRTGATREEVEDVMRGFFAAAAGS